ncbi:MAG: GvpL/GvpF family gas vesicle protein [Clostridia bacterium]|nr:GvpL/GvpF family gas vesicle protein [Clostridia bacterium]
MKYVYGIIGVAEDKPWLVQAAGQWGVEIVRQGSIAAVIREVDSKAVRVGQEEILHHEEVIELVMGQQTILPARFGTVLTDPRAVDEVLSKYYSRFQDLLRELADKLEMGVRVIWQPPAKVARKELPVTEPPETGTAETETPVSGRAYLLAKWQDYRMHQEWDGQGQAIVRGIHESISPLAVKWRLTNQLSPTLLFSGAYLIENDKVEAFRDRCRSLLHRYPELKFLCSGPWPPYNFSGLKSSNT